MRLAYVYRPGVSALAALLWVGVALAQQPPVTSLLKIEAATASSGRGAMPAQALAPLSLQSLIEEAMEQNPEIKVMQRSFDMMHARVPQAKALPEPMLSYGYTGNAVPLPPLDIQKGDPFIQSPPTKWAEIG